jgi:hypothetical protein
MKQANNNVNIGNAENVIPGSWAPFCQISDVLGLRFFMVDRCLVSFRLINRFFEPIVEFHCFVRRSRNILPDIFNFFVLQSHRNQTRILIALSPFFPVPQFNSGWRWFSLG